MIKIKYIKFYDHPIFKNQQFDFTYSDGKSANNIIFAGENGVGKTKMLEELKYICSNEYYCSITIYDRKKFEVLIDVTDEEYYVYGQEEKKINEAKLIFSVDPYGGESRAVRFIYDGNEEIMAEKKGTNVEVLTLLMKCMYSGVDINYKPQTDVNGVTNKTLDNDFYENTMDIAQETIQLLVDIAAQDNADLDSWVNENECKVLPKEMYRVRLRRFTNAFNSMFGDNLKYKRIDKNTNPIFEKAGREVSITNLSSGEKQIVFRGVNLLRNKNSLSGMPVLIDEPELSMHPKWEEKIFNYYNNLFVANDIQTSQLFMATHSEHILENVLKREDSIVIRINNDSYQKFYKGSNGEILPTISISEIKYSIFDMYTVDFHIMLYGYIQQNIIQEQIGHSPNISETDKFLEEKAVTLKKYEWNIDYETLQTYIRNCIDHPDNIHSYTEQELKVSINEMIEIITNNIATVAT